MQQPGITDVVGGLTDGFLGAAAFDFRSEHDSISARKSWFFFEGRYVCLGAGIASNAGSPVVTTINQCLLRAPVATGAVGKEHFHKDGEPASVTRSEEHTSELQSLMRSSYAVFCLKTKK